MAICSVSLTPQPSHDVVRKTSYCPEESESGNAECVRGCAMNFGPLTVSCRNHVPEPGS